MFYSFLIWWHHVTTTSRELGEGGAGTWSAPAGAYGSPAELEAGSEAGAQSGRSFEAS